MGLYVAAIQFANRRRLKPRLAVFAFALVWVVPVALSGWTAYSDGTPQKMFERLVARPIPASVRNFKWAGGVGIDGGYVLTFEADAGDMQRLVERLRLRLGDSASAEAVNRRASNHCVGYGMPYVPFVQPLSYCQTNETPSGWTRQLLTDSEQRRAYVFAH